MERTAVRKNHLAARNTTGRGAAAGDLLLDEFAGQFPAIAGEVVPEAEAETTTSALASF
jgi:hypothetical protein